MQPEPDTISSIDEGDFYNTLHAIKTVNLTKVVYSLVSARTDDYIRDRVVVDFWSFFQNPQDSNHDFIRFYKAVDMLYKCYFQFSRVMVKLDLLIEENTNVPNQSENSAVRALKLSVRAALLAKLPVSHKTIIESFYETALKLEEKKNVEIADQICGLCALTIHKCRCLQNFYDTNRYIFIIAECFILNNML